MLPDYLRNGTILLIGLLAGAALHAMEKDKDSDDQKSEQIDPQAVADGNVPLAAPRPEPILCPVCLDAEPVFSPCGRGAQHPTCERCAARIFAQHNGGECPVCRQRVPGELVIIRFRQFLQSTDRGHQLPQRDKSEPHVLSIIRRIYDVPTVVQHPHPIYDDLTLQALQEHQGNMPRPWLEALLRNANARRRWQRVNHHPRRRAAHPREVEAQQIRRPVPPPLSCSPYHWDPERRMPPSERGYGHGRKRNKYGPRWRQTWAFHSPSDYNSPPFQ